MSHALSFVAGAATGLTGALWLATGKVMLLALGQPGDAAGALILSLAALALVVWLMLSAWARDAVILGALMMGAVAVSINMGVFAQ